MAKSKANTTAGARPKASRREGRAPAAATAKAETGGSALRGRSAAPTKQAAVIGLLQREGGATLASPRPSSSGPGNGTASAFGPDRRVLAALRLGRIAGRALLLDLLWRSPFKAPTFRRLKFPAALMKFPAAR